MRDVLWLSSYRFRSGRAIQFFGAALPDRNGQYFVVPGLEIDTIGGGEGGPNGFRTGRPRVILTSYDHEIISGRAGKAGQPFHFAAAIGLPPLSALLIAPV